MRMKTKPYSTSLLEDGLRALVVEVTRQVEQALELLDRGETTLRESIVDRDDYVDSLKLYLGNNCFNLMYQEASLKKRQTNLIRAVGIIAGNLERIGDHTVNIARQTVYLKNPAFMHGWHYHKSFKLIHDSLQRISKALFNRNSDQAMKICKAEETLDQEYIRNFNDILEALRNGKEVENHLTASFILRYLERIGDCLLNIGEAILFSIVGDRLKYEQFNRLKKGLDKLDAGKFNQLELEGFLGTRSGCRIGLARTKGGDGLPMNFVFKEGKRKKIEAEKNKIEHWHGIMPGITPKVLEFQSDKDHASLMTEFITGRTLQQKLHHKDGLAFRLALRRLLETLQYIWTKTKEPTKRSSRLIEQLLQRVPDVFRAHPYFEESAKQIGDLQLASIGEKLERLRKLEAKLKLPFQVWVHGDFNLDNIFHLSESNKIQFIDVHRSEPGDYVQDVTVFLVSGFRQKVFDRTTRLRIQECIGEMLSFTRKFAQENQDPDFEVRLALGLIRNLITSTRFEFQSGLAYSMFWRANYLIDRLELWQRGELDEFVIPDETFIY